MSWSFTISGSDICVCHSEWGFETKEAADAACVDKLVGLLEEYNVSDEDEHRAFSIDIEEVEDDEDTDISDENEECIVEETECISES